MHCTFKTVEFDLHVPTSLPTVGVLRVQKLKAPLVEAQGYQRFPLSKPVVGLNIALDAVPAYPLSAFPDHSTCFSQKKSKSSTVECILSRESEFDLW